MAKKTVSLVKDMKRFYEKFYDWESLYESLMQSTQHCALINTKADFSLLQYTISKHENSKEVRTNNLTKLKILTSNDWINPKDLKRQVLPYYLLDMASIPPVLALDIKPNDCVLDMCAAPGGKSIVIWQYLQNGLLVSNDASKKRYQRLKKVLKEYISYWDESNKNVVATNWPGERFGVEERNMFDKVLIDAPCSAERHVVQDNFVDAGWSVRKMKSNAEIQYRLIDSGLKCLKRGGIMVYSTCALTPIENDDVIEKSMENIKNHQAQLDDIEELKKDTVMKFNDNVFHLSNNTKHGLMIIPQLHRNWGPMYFTRIKKL